ncbi:hypothetical protein EAF04_002865 [Stromatinia cepivora]|nr:hypothetical protein EAF04_002865 [Stromatinia cepivora]
MEYDWRELEYLKPYLEPVENPRRGRIKHQQSAAKIHERKVRFDQPSVQPLPSDNILEQQRGPYSLTSYTAQQPGVARARTRIEVPTPKKPSTNLPPARVNQSVEQSVKQLVPVKKTSKARYFCEMTSMLNSDDRHGAREVR